MSDTVLFVPLHKGLAGEVFSNGFYSLASGISDLDTEVFADVYEYWSEKEVEGRLRSLMVKHRYVNILQVGHSLGARHVLKRVKALRKFDKTRVKVKGIICLDYVCNALGCNDLTAPMDIPTWHIRTTDPRTRNLKHALEIPCSVSHIDMDDDPWVQNFIVEKAYELS